MNVSTRKPRSATQPAGPATRAPAQESNQGIVAAFAALADILRSASNTDEAEQYTGNSDRLLRIAADLAEQFAAEASTATLSRGDAENPAYDIAALVSAALRVPGDTASKERLKHIAAAKQLLQMLTECEDVLREDPAAVSAREQLNAVQLRRVLEVIAARSDSLNDLLIQAQGAETEGEAFVSLNAAQVLAVYIGGMADAASGSRVRGNADYWSYGSDFASLGKAVQA